MPILKSRLFHSDRRPQLQRRKQSRRVAPARCKLDSSTRLIAPAHTLSLPTLEGIKDCFEFSLGSEAALPLARALIRRGLLLEKHLQAATSPVGALETALAEIVTQNFCGAQDEFDISVCISDRLEDYRKPDNVLFFTWSNSPDPQYMPLRPVFERLQNNPNRDRLMASLYRWLYSAASKVFDAFGFDEAKSVYTWRKEWYAEARENGEDVDVEGEVEASDPAKDFAPCYWGNYRHVNKKYAAAISEHVHESEYVWVHDYHLMLVAEELRNIGVSQTLAYFHHIPFPSPDIFAKLPWRSDLLRAMLRFDVLGFQTGRDLRNFVRCFRRFLPGEARISSRGKRVMFESNNGLVTAGAFPISIDFQEFSNRASSMEVTEMAIALRQNINANHCLLGVDRLDYTKGILERLRAFELLLEQSRELHRKVTLVQVVVPSREDIPKYQELKQEVECMVTSINGRFTRDGWVPIHYVYRRLNRDQLLAHYKAADIALITPLKDGMNLVAKEFCAAQNGNEGVLILSEFAGAAQQLKAGALLVNPNDLEGVANAIRRAMMSSRTERLCAMRTMRRSIAKENVSAWAQSFCSAVNSCATEAADPLACAVSA